MTPITIDRTSGLLSIFAALGVAFVMFLNRGAFADAPVLAASSVASSTAEALPSPGLPARLIIPKIGLSAHVEQVGLTRDGSMGAPKLPMAIGWLATSPRPGGQGTAVLDGHRGWRDRIRAAFDDLHELAAGDDIYVEDDRGAMRRFVVRGSKTYVPGADDASVFAARPGSNLVLITCDGDWNAAAQSYSRRLVVFADAS